MADAAPDIRRAIGGPAQAVKGTYISVSMGADDRPNPVFAEGHPRG
jgi:hypothetical protein